MLSMSFNLFPVKYYMFSLFRIRCCWRLVWLW